MRPVKIISRASKLALVQSNHVRTLLSNICPEIDVSVVDISTKGDRDKSDFLYKSDSVGFFTSEVENALLDKRADIAVHSLKDLPTACTDGLLIAAIGQRESVADVLVTTGAVTCLGDLPSGSTVGTSSLRRTAQLKHFRHDLEIVALRGNVETRVKKVSSGQIDAAVIASAGLNRLGMAEVISVLLEPTEFLPAPGQGALAIQTRDADAELIKVVSQLDDESTRIAVQAERQILAAMHGGCSIPLGVYARVVDDSLVIDAMIASVDGQTMIRSSDSTSLDKIQACVEKMTEELLSAGGKEILKQVRDIKKE